MCEHISRHFKSRNLRYANRIRFLFGRRWFIISRHCFFVIRDFIRSWRRYARSGTLKYFSHIKSSILKNSSRLCFYLFEWFVHKAASFLKQKGDKFVDKGKDQDNKKICNARIEKNQYRSDLAENKLDLSVSE